MNCEKVFAWLLGCATWDQLPSEIWHHLQECARCRKHWRRLIRLETVLATESTVNESPALENFLREHGFAPSYPPAQEQRRESATTLPMVVQSRESIQHGSALRWWMASLVVALALPLGLGLVWWLTLPSWDTVHVAGAIADTTSSANPKATDPNQSSEPSVTPGDGFHASSSSTQAQTSGVQPMQPESPFAHSTASSGTFPQGESPTPPTDLVRFLAHIHAEVQALEQLLQCALPLVWENQDCARTNHLLRLTLCVGEEVLRQADREALDTLRRDVEWFMRGVRLAHRLCTSGSDAERGLRAQAYAHRFDDLAERARMRAKSRPAFLKEGLREFREHAEQMAQTLRKLAPSRSYFGPGLQPVWQSTYPLEQALPDATERGNADGSPWPSANESAWWYVVFLGEGDAEIAGSDSPAAYLLWASIGRELWDLTMRCALRLAEESDPLQRMEAALDWAEGLLRGVAVLCSAGPNPLARQLSRHLNSLLTGTLRTNWPAVDRVEQAAQTSRRQAWQRSLQRLEDMSALLHVGEEQLPAEIQAAWRSALAELAEGITALEAACERGLPQPWVPRQPEGKPLTGVPTDPPATRAKPPGKPPAEPPRKPEKSKPPKLPFKPYKPFPERFKDIKDFWEGKKR
ncbi:MAG: hypothetical protein RMI91_14755 [Gemmatales bacterium]|nr:hypothetical protein [Gemmatales bacterium]MDW7995905.1 hypothetical protein [Gemmatales bacterium]